MDSESVIMYNEVLWCYLGTILFYLWACFLWKYFAFRFFYFILPSWRYRKFIQVITTFETVVLAETLNLIARTRFVRQRRSFIITKRNSSCTGSAWSLSGTVSVVNSVLLWSLSESESESNNKEVLILCSLLHCVFQ